MSEELDLARRVARAVRDAGGRALIVGGWVRDTLRGVDSKDIDIEAYGLPADKLHAVLAGLGPVNSVGASFAVFKLGPLDVSLPRTESKAGRGHRGFTVIGDPQLPLAAAARRRDFTVNAIARDPLQEEYLDPHGGRADLARGLLRMVDPATFGDDSLRVLRAMQLAARLEFDVDEPTRAVCRTIALDDLPAERIWGEFDKLLLRPAAVDRPRARARHRGRPAPVPRTRRPDRLPAGTGMAPGRGRLDPHAAGGRPGPRADRRSATAAAGRGDAGRGMP